MLKDAADLLGDFAALYKAMNTYQVKIHGQEERVSLLQSEAGVANSLYLLHADIAHRDVCTAREKHQQAEQERDPVVQQLQESQGRNRSLHTQPSTTAGDLEGS